MSTGLPSHRSTPYCCTILHDLPRPPGAVALERVQHGCIKIGRNHRWKQNIEMNWSRIEWPIAPNVTVQNFEISKAPKALAAPRRHWWAFFTRYHAELRFRGGEQERDEVFAFAKVREVKRRARPQASAWMCFETREYLVAATLRGRVFVMQDNGWVFRE